MAVATIGYAVACMIATVGHVLFSGINAPTPFLATWRASLIALVALIVLILFGIVRMIAIGGEAVKAYHQSSDEEKAFLRRITIAIFKRVKQTDGKWGQRAKAAEEFYREVKP
jgi:hypothetical protein